jgi:hypothetical protein
MDTPAGAAKNLKPEQNALSVACDELGSPLCAQCRSPMIVVLFEPDFENSIVATYRCAECGLLDRAQLACLADVK